MAVHVYVVCDFCKQRSPMYPSLARATTDLLNERGWSLMVIARKTRHRCNQCTAIDRRELA